jgi:hypothetical protein
MVPILSMLQFPLAKGLRVQPTALTVSRTKSQLYNKTYRRQKWKKLWSDLSNRYGKEFEHTKKLKTNEEYERISLT